MPPSWDQTGVPGDEALAHFHSSTTSGSASWMSSRIRFSTEPRQSPSSRMRWSIICEAEFAVRERSVLGLSPARRAGAAALRDFFAIFVDVLDVLAAIAITPALRRARR